MYDFSESNVRNAGKSFANIFIDPLVIPQAA